MWRDDAAGVAVRFVGFSGELTRRQVLDLVAPHGIRLALLDQVHSARVVEAREGLCGRADALVTREGTLALSLVTADCVPVMVARGRSLAAVHAGWRGIAAGIVAAAVAALEDEPESPVEEATAWIGPAIGPCCYEVSDEVAARVVAVSDGSVVVPQPGGRPHLDLPAAVSRQLEQNGIRQIRRFESCTRCHPGQLCSYRRDGEGAGRNLSFIWRQPRNSAPAAG